MMALVFTQMGAMTCQHVTMTLWRTVMTVHVNMAQEARRMV